MKSGTAIGLLVGGAVLILAAKPSTAATAGQGGSGASAPLVGGALNPLNWFNGSLSHPAAPNIFAPASVPYMPPAANYNPAATGGLLAPGGFNMASLSPAYSPANTGLLSPGYNFNPGGGLFADNPALTVAGGPLQTGFQPAAYVAQAASPAYSFPVMTPAGGFYNAASPSPGTGVQTAAYTASSPGYQSNLQTVSL